MNDDNDHQSIISEISAVPSTVISTIPVEEKDTQQTQIGATDTNNPIVTTPEVTYVNPNKILGEGLSAVEHSQSQNAWLEHLMDISQVLEIYIRI